MGTDKITSSYRLSLGEDQTVFDVTIQNDEGGNISKILSACANAYVDEMEMLSGEAHYTGGIVFDLLFMDENGANHLLSEKVDLHGKIQNDQINPFMKPIYKVETIDTKVLGVDEDSAKLSATIAIKLDAIRTDQVEEVNAKDDSIQLNKELASTTVVVASGTKTFEVTEQFETKMDIKRMLCAKAHVDLKNANDGTGYFAVEGDIFLNALSEVDDGGEDCLKNFMETVSFKEEFEDEAIQKGDQILASAYVRPQDVVLSVTDEEDKLKTIAVKIIVTIKYIAQRTVETEIYTDAFSMTNKTNILSGTFMLDKQQKLERFNATIDGQTNLDDDEARIARVCAVTNEHILIANAVVADDELIIEGVAYATVIYQTDDDQPTYNSMDLEIPFASKFDVDSNFYGDMFVTSDIVDVDTKVKKGKEINIALDVCFLTYCYARDNQVVVKDIELTEPLPDNKFSLEMYVAPTGSTAWDVSKHLLVTEHLLFAQNPELVFPLDKPATIVHFKQRT